MEADSQDPRKGKDKKKDDDDSHSLSNFGSQAGKVLSVPISVWFLQVFSKLKYNLSFNF